MPNLHVLMTNHTDINSIELLISELPFIGKHYDTLLVECVPCSFSNQKALNYLRSVMLTYVIDLTPIAEQLAISKKHLLALKNEFAEEVSDEVKMSLKYEAVKEIKANTKIVFEQGINQVFFQYYYYHYLSQAFKLDIGLIGIEHSSYSPGRGIGQVNRNGAIVSNTLKIAQEHSNCLMMVGATHGVDLIKSFRKQEIVKNNYTHLYCDASSIPSQSPSQLFKIQIETGDYVLSENQSYSYCNLFSESKEQQVRLLKNRVMATKSNKPSYHDYGRTVSKEPNSFCFELSRLSGLLFFTVIDKSYFADAICELNTKEKKQLAQLTQEKLGLGEFFKKDSGKSVFVVKNTNVPEHIDTMQNAINGWYA